MVGVTFAATLLGSCQSLRVDLQTIPLTAGAAELPPIDPDGVRVVEISQAPKRMKLIPIARGTGVGPVSTPSIPKRLAARWEKMGRPDLIVFRRGGDVYQGSTAQYVGFGVTLSQPIFAKSVFWEAYRIAPFRVGVLSDETGMVVAMTEDSRESGIQEGDKLISVNGKPVGRNGGVASDFDSVAHALAPGQVVELVWIRPGTGRMSGSVELGENDVSELEALPRFPVKEYGQGEGDGHWRNKWR